jgi:hypothetical protein
VYSIATGAVLRTWSANGGIGFNPADPEALSWTSDQRTLAFLRSTPGNSPLQGIWLLNMSLGGSNLFADSRQAMSLETTWSSAAVACQNDMIITPDGSSVICGGSSLNNSQSQLTAFLKYSPASKQVASILGQWTAPKADISAVDLLWSNPSGSVVIGEIPNSGDGQVGMITDGTFTKLSGLGSPGIAAVDEGAW